MDDDEMAWYLVSSRLAGAVSTTVANTRSKIAGLLDGDPRCTFGLSRCASASLADIDSALLAAAGETLSDHEALGYIDPRKTLAGMRRHASALRPFLAGGGGTILIATGHPGGMLEHYIEIGRRLAASGNTLLRPLDGGGPVETGFELEPESSIRFVGDVGCVYRKPGALAHSHLAHYMQAMLDELAREGRSVDLVIGDHGMAGAALERGIPTLSIADVNDIPLQLVDGGGPQSLLVVDDNRPAHFFRPVTDYILDNAQSHEP